MGLIDLQRQILALCYGASPSEETLAALGQREIWLTYRQMIRERLLREVKLALPRSCALVGPAMFDQAFAFHLEHEPPRTRYFREVVGAFVASALRLWAPKPELALACDTARYELALWEVRDLPILPALPVMADRALSEFSFERVAVVSRALRLLELSHPVHQDEDQTTRSTAAGPGPYYLCVHRAADQERPKVWSLTRSTFGLLAALVREDRVVSAVVRQGAQRVDAGYLDALCETLAQFLELGIILGSR